MKDIVALASEQNKSMITALGRVRGRPDTIDVLRDSGCSTMVIIEDLYMSIDISRARQDVV